VLYGDWTSDSGYRAGVQLAANPEVTAIFAANDQMALGAIRAMHEAGRPVPEQVSVVGFDDIEDAGNYWPPLTTVHQDFTELGRRAVAALIGEITGEPHATGTDRVPTRLVVRKSTAPPPA
jgi:DNA-binding LacI/PurR family transcriptional regulator